MSLDRVGQMTDIRLVALAYMTVLGFRHDLLLWTRTKANACRGHG